VPVRSRLRVLSYI